MLVAQAYEKRDLLQNKTNVSQLKSILVQNQKWVPYPKYADRQGWVVNFADASAKGGGEPGLIYRYGKAVGSKKMQQFTAFLCEQEGNVNHYNYGRDLFRTLENLDYHNELV